MAAINGNRLFRESKRKTRAYKALPKTVKEMLNISNIYENGIFKIEPGKGKCMYDSCYVFEDINYIKLDGEDKKGILLQLMNWLNSMGTDFKISLANEYRNLDAYMEELFTSIHGEEYPELERGLEQWKRDRMREGNPQMNTVRYLVVTCHAESETEAQIYFNALDESLHRLFSGWKSRIYKLKTEERLRILHAFFHAGKEIPFCYHNEYNSGTMWKNSILPTDIRSFSNFMIMDELYVSVLFAAGYEESLDEEKVISSLSRVDFPSYVTIDYAPVKRRVLRGKLEAAHMNNEKAISEELDRKRKAGLQGTGISYSKEKKKDELEEYQDQVADNNEGCFFVGLLVAVTADSEDELASRVERMKYLGSENGVQLVTYNYRQLKALNTVLPFGGRQVDVMIPMLTSSVIALQPYYAQDVQEKGGHVYGTNRTTKNLIIGNRKKMMNPHGIIIGHSGSGKSFFINETEIAQTLLDSDDDIIIIDPQNEFETFCRSCGGEFFDLTPKSSLHLNPLEVSEELFYASPQEKEQFVAIQTEYLKSFCTVVMKNIEVTQEHYSIIDECTRMMYQSFFEKSRLKRQVTLKEFREELLHKSEKSNERMKGMIEQIYNSLGEFTEGTYDLFAYPSNVSIRNRYTVFGLKNVSDKMWEPVMITIMHFLSNRMEYNQKYRKATHLIVDETQEVCENETSAKELLRATVTFRKFGGICTMAMQNVTRALENPDLRDMFSNCNFKCFFDQGGVDARELAQIQEFSTEEFYSLSEEKPGCGVMVLGKKVLLLDAYMEHDNPLYEMFNTNFHEKAEQNRHSQNRRTEIVPTLPEQKEETKPEEQSLGMVSNEGFRKAVCKLAELSSITLQDIAYLLDVEMETATEVVKELCEEGILEKQELAGKIFFRAK